MLLLLVVVVYFTDIKYNECVCVCVLAHARERAPLMEILDNRWMSLVVHSTLVAWLIAIRFRYWRLGKEGNV